MAAGINQAAMTRESLLDELRVYLREQARLADKSSKEWAAANS